MGVSEQIQNIVGMRYQALVPSESGFVRFVEHVMGYLLSDAFENLPGDGWYDFHVQRWDIVQRC